MTTEAFCKLSPTPPASVEINTCTESSSRKRSISSPRLLVGTLPCKCTKPTPISCKRCSTIVVISFHCENTTAFKPDCTQSSSIRFSISSSLGEPTVSLSTRPAALHAILALCNAAIIWFCSPGVRGRALAILAKRPAAETASSCSSACFSVSFTSKRCSMRLGN